MSDVRMPIKGDIEPDTSGMSVATLQNRATERKTYKTRENTIKARSEPVTYVLPKHPSKPDLDEDRLLKIKFKIQSSELIKAKYLSGKIDYSKSNSKYNLVS
jgi:hypothetical protein